MARLGPNSQGISFYTTAGPPATEHLASADIAGSGLVDAIASLLFAASLAVSGLATVSADASLMVGGASDIGGSAVVSATAIESLSGSSAITGSAAVTASGSVGTDGITQPGACGTTTFFQDDTRTDADSDGDNDTYSPADIVLKGLPCADTTNLGTFANYYKSKCSIQNGDGVGTATTTFKGTNLALSFDSGKTYAVSTVGQANRWTKLGEKVQGAVGKPSGKNGVSLDVGTTTTFRGNMLIYGSKIRNTAANALFFTPGAAGLTGEIIDCLLETTSGAGNMVFGTSAGSLQYMYNVDMTLGGTGVVTQFFVDYVERISIAVTGSNAYCVNSGADYAIRDVVFIGTPTTADIRQSAATANLINPTYTGNAPQFGFLSLAKEWFSYEPITQAYDTGIPVASINVKVLDVDGASVFDMASDALGGFAYNTGTVYENAILMRTAAGSTPVVTDRGPFTTRVNMDGSINPAYAGYTYKWSPRYSSLPSNYGKQLRPMLGEVVPIYPAGFFDSATVTVVRAGGGSSTPIVIERVTIGLAGVSAAGIAGTVVPPMAMKIEVIPDVLLRFKVEG